MKNLIKLSYYWLMSKTIYRMGARIWAKIFVETLFGEEKKDGEG